jgi:uncharacterized Zn-finger protein
LRELSKAQKLRVAAIAVVCGLIVYAVGVLTFLQSPVFSMFWIVSSQTALDAIYVAAATAAALSIIILSIVFIRKRKGVFSEKHNIRFMGTFKASSEARGIVTLPPDCKKTSSYPGCNETEQKTVSNPGGSKSVQKNPSAVEPIMQSSKQSATQISAEQNTDGNATINREADVKVIKNKDKITCPACKREFSTPLFSLDYSSSNPKLIRLCPYCDKNLDLEPKNA